MVAIASPIAPLSVDGNLYLITDQGDIVALARHAGGEPRAAKAEAPAEACARASPLRAAELRGSAPKPASHMLPVIAIVGRPNVGKSTLFNTLTKTRDAIVADVPGVTRDRQYGYGKLGPVQYVCIDTGGLVENPSGMDALMRIQTEHAIREADRLIFVADARDGLTPRTSSSPTSCAAAGKPVFLAVNKAEGLISGMAGADFHSIGLGEPYAISATHGSGCEELMDIVLAGFPPHVRRATRNEDGRIRIAVIGRPNVGKSTLINRLIGDERLITSEVAGTTRDSILVPFERDGRELHAHRHRRRAPAREDRRRESRSCRCRRRCRPSPKHTWSSMVVDAQDSIGEQDASVLGLALSRGRALILAVNKWDNIPPEQARRHPPAARRSRSISCRSRRCTS